MASSIVPTRKTSARCSRPITRQVLFSDPQMRGELRYFEMAPGGFSTLERHEHMHAVLILRGARALPHRRQGRTRRDTNDLVTRAADGPGTSFAQRDDEPLGFLCMVDAERDKPQLPTNSEFGGTEEESADRGVP